MTNEKPRLNIRAYGYVQFELIIKDNNDKDFLPMLMWDFIDWEYKSSKEPVRIITPMNDNEKLIYSDSLEKFMLDLVNGKLINRNTRVKDELLYRIYQTDDVEIGNYYNREILLEFIDNDNEMFEKYKDIHVKFRMLNMNKILNDFTMGSEILNKLSIEKINRLYKEDLK